MQQLNSYLHSSLSDANVMISRMDVSINPNEVHVHDDADPLELCLINQQKTHLDTLHQSQLKDRPNGWKRFCHSCVVYTVVILIVWALVFILFGKSYAFPGGPLFSLLLLEVSAILLGNLTESIRLPPLLGMVGAGLLLRNVPANYSGFDLPLSLSSPLRGLSVVVLLTRGAFSVNPNLIRKYRFIVPQLAIVPCLIEALAAGILVHLILQFPLKWAALMGCIISAMSGAAALPYLNALDKTKPKCQIQNDVITIAKTACGLDAILAICLAEVALGFIFGNGVSEGLAKGLGEVSIGAVFGVIWGSLAGQLLTSRNSTEIRTLALFSGGILSLLGFTKIGYPRGGPPGVYIGSLVTSVLWRRKQIDGINDGVNEHLKKLWFIFQPLLFGILGSRIDLEVIDWSILTQASICIALSLCVRAVSVIVMCSWNGLSWNQKILLALCWIPKGTVQAALGCVALDTTVTVGSIPEVIDLSHHVMSVAVLAILFIPTFGSLLLQIIGPRLLNKTI